MIGRRRIIITTVSWECVWFMGEREREKETKVMERN